MNSSISGFAKGLEPQPGDDPTPKRSWYSPSRLWHRKTTIIATFSVAAIALHLVLRFGLHTAPDTYQIPLLATLVLGGLPMLY